VGCFAKRSLNSWSIPDLCFPVFFSFTFFHFSARDVIYISHAYAMMSVTICLSVCLSVTFVFALWSKGARILDIFACLNRWMSLLLTENASPGSSDGMMPGFVVEDGWYGKIGNCSDITYFTYFLSMDRKHVTYLFM